MFKSKWTPEKVAVLVEKYAETKNAVLVAELGMSMRTIERKAASLGLKKSERFLQEVSREGLMEVEYMRITGTMPKKKGQKTAGSFKKGHRFCSEIEAKRIKAIRDRAWDERVREIRGWERKTNWKLKKFQ